MTDPRSPSGEHLDLDALADVLAGERPDDPHLASCAACRARLAELAAADTAVLASLGGLADPPLPDGLAERLHRSLADEARADQARADQARAGGIAPGSRRVVALRPRRAWRQPVAACLALVLAGGLGWTLVRGGTGGTDTDSAATAADGSDAGTEGGGGGVAGGERAAALPRTRTGTDWADAGAGRTALPQVLAGLSDSALSGGAESAPSGPPAAAPSDAAALDPTPRSADPLARLRDPVTLEACLAAVSAQDGAQPLALDEGTVRGAPALAVLLPDADPAFVRLHVVGPACSAADPATLLRTRVPRP